MRRLAWLGLAVGLLAASLLLIFGLPDDGSAAPERTDHPAQAPDAGTMARDGAAVGAAGAEDIDRTEVTVDSADTRSGAGASVEAGDLHITVVHHQTRAPMPHAWVRIYLWDNPNPYANVRFEQVDAAGRLELPAIATGRMLACLFRNDDDGGSVRTELVAGQVTEVELVLEQGVTISGVVLDPAGALVADAGIWLSRSGSMAEGAVIAHSAIDGSFKLENISSGHWVGARKAGFAPTINPMIIASVGAELDLTLRLTGIGGAVEGVVLDPAGKPVASAVVLVGYTNPRHQSLPGGESGYKMPAQRAQTDAEGRFRVDGLTAETMPVWVRAKGWGFFADTVEVFPSETTQFEVRLQQGVTAVGQVTDAAGAPVARARVDNGLHGLAGFRVRTNSDGRYRIEDLPSGEFRLFAQAADGEGVKVEETFQAAPGKTTEWNPVLAGGLSLRLRIIDENGVGRDGMFVEIRGEPENGEKAHFGWESSDAEGRLVFEGCPDQPYFVEVRAKDGGVFSAVQRRGLRVGGDEIVITVSSETDASIHLRGRLLMPDGSPAGAATVVPIMGSGGAPIETPDATTGVFELGPYPPGEWSLWAELPGYPNVYAGPEPVAKGETWEVGDLQFQDGGTLRVLLDRSALAADAAAKFVVLSGARVNRNTLTWDGDLGLSRLLSPGEHTLAWDGVGTAAGSISFTIRPGEESLLTVRPTPGSLHHLVVEFEEEETALATIHFEIWQDGRRHYGGRLWRWLEPKFKRYLHLGPGTWTVVVSTTDGRQVEGNVDSSDAEETLTLVLPARGDNPAER